MASFRMVRASRTLCSTVLITFSMLKSRSATFADSRDDRGRYGNGRNIAIKGTTLSFASEADGHWSSISEDQANREGTRYAVLRWTRSLKNSWKKPVKVQ